MAVDLTLPSKNTVSATLPEKSGNPTWEEYNDTWQEAEGTWDTPNTPRNSMPSKSNVTLSFPAKS